MSQEPLDRDASLREHLVKLLTGGQAHTDFETAVAKLLPEHQGRKPPGAPHSPWQLLEHLRIAQRDILEFSRNPGHVSPKWPDGYWPKEDAPPEDESWERSLEDFRSDLEAFRRLVKDPATDLYAPIPGGTGQTVLREGMLIADHNAYHVGQLVLIRRLLKAW
jgi:hypothetical protein